MIKDSWNKIKLVCGNHGEDYSHEMQFKQGPHSLFYSCPEYKSLLDKNSRGKSCNNRLTLVDYENLLHHLMDKTFGEDCTSETNLTGYEWNYKGVYYKVLKHEKDTYTVLMLNKKAIAK